MTSAIGWLIHAGRAVACARLELFDWEFLAVCVGTICCNLAQCCFALLGLGAPRPQAASIGADLSRLGLRV